MSIICTTKISTSKSLMLRLKLWLIKQLFLRKTFINLLHHKSLPMLTSSSIGLINYLTAKVVALPPIHRCYPSQGYSDVVIVVVVVVALIDKRRKVFFWLTIWLHVWVISFFDGSLDLKLSLDVIEILSLPTMPYSCCYF